MGTKLAPALATIYVGELEEKFLSQHPKQPTLWKRFIDDVFMVWPHTLEELHEFLRGLNGMQKKIKFTAEISTHSCDFLDLTIYKSPTFYATGKLSTKIFYKPTNSFSYPLGSSCMPTSIHKGIAIGEMTRLIRNTTSPTLRRHYSRKLIRHFKRRKYPPHIIKRLTTMRHLPRIQALRKSHKKRIDKPLPFITKYRKYNFPLNSLLRKCWSSIYNDKHLYPLYPTNPFTVYTNHKSLRSTLSHKRRVFGGNPDQENLQSSSTKPFKFIKFNHPRPLAFFRTKHT